MMNICICVTNFKSDLVEAISRNTVELAAGMAADGITTVRLLVPGGGPAGMALAPNLVWESFAPERVYSSKIRVLKNIMALGRWLRREKRIYDLIHIQLGTPLELFLMFVFLPRCAPVRIATVWQPYLGFWDSIVLLGLFGRNVTAIGHHYVLNSWLLVPFYAVGQLFFTNIIFPTIFQKNQAYYVPNKKKHVIANGVADTSLTSSVRSEPNGTGDANIKTSEKISILYVGHATGVKGLDIFLRALEIVFREVPDLRATLALSSFGKHDDVHAMIRRLKIGERVSLKGKVDVAQEMAAHHILALPLKASVGTTCYPNTLLEAFAAGIPIVASNVTVIREATGEGGLIPLSPPGDVKKFAAAILLLARNPQRRRAISAYQRDLYVNRFTLEQYIESHWRLYSRLLDNSSLR